MGQCHVLAGATWESKKKLNGSCGTCIWRQYDGHLWSPVSSNNCQWLKQLFCTFGAIASDISPEHYSGCVLAVLMLLFLEDKQIKDSFLKFCLKRACLQYATDRQNNVLSSSLSEHWNRKCLKMLEESNVMIDGRKSNMVVHEDLESFHLWAKRKKGHGKAPFFVSVNLFKLKS